jgi:hypothetical protein
VPDPEVAAETLCPAPAILTAHGLMLGGMLPKIIFGVVQVALELYAGLSDRVLNVEIGVVFELFVRQAW